VRRTLEAAGGKALELLGYRHSNDEWFEGVLFDDPCNTQPERWASYIPVIAERARHFGGFQDIHRYSSSGKWIARFPVPGLYTMRDPDRLAASNINHFRTGGRPDHLLPSCEKIIGRNLKRQASVYEYFAGRDDCIKLNWEAGDGRKELCAFPE
jgi:hypothetical protein